MSSDYIAGRNFSSRLKVVSWAEQFVNHLHGNGTFLLKIEFTTSYVELAGMRYKMKTLYPCQDHFMPGWT